MAQQVLNVGTAANDGTGESLRSGMVKVNTMFGELYGPVAQFTVAASGTLALTTAHQGGTIILAGTGATVSINATTLGDGFACKILNRTGADWTVPTPTGGGLSFDYAGYSKVISGGHCGLETFTWNSARYVHVAGTVA
jgi:hypothetical protein